MKEQLLLIYWFSTSLIYKVDECDIEYIQLVDQLFSVNIDLTNYYKIGNMVNGKGTTRNSQLSFTQQSIVNTNSIKNNDRIFNFIMFPFMC